MACPCQGGIGPAFDALEELFNGSEGQAWAMLSAIGLHFTIAGECYLIGRKVDGIDIWEIRSVMEVDCSGTRNNATWTIKSAGGQPVVTLGDEDVVIRLTDPPTRPRRSRPTRPSSRSSPSWRRSSG